MSKLPTMFRSTAEFSPCCTYRYELVRSWGTWATEKPMETFCAFVGLNPSTADEAHNDPTVRRCILFAQSWGYTSMVMLNLNPFRATKPQDMLAHVVGRDADMTNWNTLNCWARLARRIVLCWGTHGARKTQGGTLPNRSSRLEWLIAQNVNP